jgi:hypothetical protein
MPKVPDYLDASDPEMRRAVTKDRIIADDGFDQKKVNIYLERIAEGWGELQAGLAHPVGWSPAQIDRFLRLEGVADLIWAIREADNEAVERAVKETALRGNPVAQKLWLYNKAAHRGWVDRRHVEVTTQAQHEIVVSVKQALQEQTRELTTGYDEAGVAALQAALSLEDDPEDTDIVDAEILEA